MRPRNTRAGRRANQEYDSALREFVAATLADPEFLVDLEGFVAPLVKPGCVDSLAADSVQAGRAGVPRLYPARNLGLGLVDPDNRRPVDFAVRAGNCWPKLPRCRRKRHGGNGSRDCPSCGSFEGF